VRAPLLPLTVALVAGILAGATWPAAWPAALPRSAAAPASLFLVSVVVTAVAGTRQGASTAGLGQRARAARLVRAATILALVSGLGLGARVGHAAHAPPLRDLVGLGNGPVPGDIRERGPHRLRMRLEDDAARTPFGASLSARVLAVDGRRLEREARGLVRLTVGGTVSDAHLADWAAGRIVEAPVWLRRASPYLNPGLADQEVVLARRGVALVGQIKSPLLVELMSPGAGWQEHVVEARRYVRHVLSQAVAPWGTRSAAVTAAILIGDRSGLDAPTELRLQKAGTFHVVAISGGNVAIFTGLVLGVLAWTRARPPLRAALALATVVVFAAAVTRGSSVWRATLMAAAALVAHAIDRPASAINIVALTVALMVVGQPSSVFDPGLWLTVGATLGILSAMPRWLSPSPAGATTSRAPPESSWRAARLAREAAGVVLATLAAEAVVMPLGAWWFHRVTVAGLLLNLLAVPAMAATQVGGLATLALWPLSSTCAWLAGGATHLAVTTLVESAVLVDWFPWVSWRVPPPPVAVLAVYYGALGAAWSGTSRARHAWTAIASATAVSIALGPAWSGLPPSYVPGGRVVMGSSAPARSGVRAPGDWDLAPGALEVTVLDVGQGDAALVREAAGPAMLVDAGGTPGEGGFDVGARITVPALWAHGVRRLDLLVLTHGDPDHAEGALAVVDDLRVDEVWEGIPVPPDTLGERVRDRARARGARRREVRRTFERAFGAWWLRVLHPPDPDWERRRVRNEDSVVVALRRAAAAVYLTGDIGRESEQGLTPALGRQPLTLVKVAHHGSAGSSATSAPARWCCGRIATGP